MDDSFAPVSGGCACGALRYALTNPPLYVHCCHCTRCQRETGGPFAHHAAMAWCDLQLTQGTVCFKQVPSDSGTRHWVASCQVCATMIWNEWGSRRAVTRYLRVGTLDEPQRFAPQAHIYIRSKQPWVTLGSVPGFQAHYASNHWPEDSRRRWQQAKALRDAQRR